MGVSTKEPFTGKHGKFAVVCDVECVDGVVTVVHPAFNYRVYREERDGKEFIYMVQE